MWERNLKYVQEHNLDADMGHHTYWLGINEHADLVSWHILLSCVLDQLKSHI